MVRNNRRKAFTIVELVIVIAVIAILAAVMIPTFTGIIKRANISADQQLAASINTQLSIYKADGNKIETEADLLAALTSDENFTAHLNPKSAKHGYHYWYDAAEQTVKLLSNDQVIVESADLRERVQAQVFAAGGDEIAEAAFNPLNFAKDAPRAVVAGFYLLDQIVDGEGNEISNFFAAIEGKTELGGDYLTALKKLDEVTGDNEILADEIVKRMKATVVVSNSGVYYHADATNATYYFAGKVTSIKANQYVFSGETITPVSGGNLPTPANNQLVLPSTVVSVEKDALKFATENSVTVVTSYATSDVLAAALAAGCSNAIFTTTDGNAYVVGIKTEENGESHDALFKYVLEGENSYVCPLKKRLPFSDFTIQCDTEGGNRYKQVGNTVYVLIANAGDAQLYAQELDADGTPTGKTSFEIDSWTSNNNDIKIESDGRIDFTAENITTTNNKAVLTAKAIAVIDGKIETVEKTINVEIVRAKSASVQIDGVNFHLDGKKDHQLTLTYDGTTTYGVTLNGVDYSTEEDVGVGTNSMTIVPGENSMISVSDNKLSLDTSKPNNTFTISFDKCIETTFYVNIIDAENADFTHTFYMSQTTERPFNIGTGNEIPLSAFLKYKGDLANFDSAKITIYDKKEGSNLYSVNEINNTDDDGLTAKYTQLINSKKEWEDAKVEFIIDKDYEDYRPGRVYTVYVEITDSDNNAVVFTINLVEDAVNVLGKDFATLDNDNENKFDYDVVLHGNVNVESGIQVDLSDNTLYGNGYIIDATSYTAVATDGVYPINDYFISINGGTIDNVYIDGPVYPTFEYTSSTLGYHVSGIKSEGASTVQYSYVSGFRQPIALNNGTLDVKDTTLYGGNYANLQVNGGTLNLHNVTTVQPENGIEDTINTTNKKHVIGLGIIVEYSAVNNNTSVINVTGYLDQYNWISYKTKADLPSFGVYYYDSAIDNGTVNMDLRKVLAALFNGVYFNCYIAKVDRKLNFLDNYYYTKDDVKYLNTGIIFLTMGTDAANAHSNVSEKLKVNDKRNEENANDEITYKELEGTKLELFSTYELINKYGIKMYASGAMKLMDSLEVDNSDGKLKGQFEWDTIKSLRGTGIDVSMVVWSYMPASGGTDSVTVGAQFNVSNNYYVINYGK